MDQAATDDIVFGIIWHSKFSNLARTCSIEMIQLAPGSAYMEIKWVTQCLLMFGHLYLVTSPDLAQLR
jgi:hypothetical protein